MQRRVRNIVYGTFFVAILIAATQFAVSSRDSLRLPVHAAMLDIIRCSPPTHPDAWLQRTTMGARLEAHDLRLGSLLHRTDVYDPNDCGRRITQAMGPKVPLNQGRSG
jgi:hypothetical protein